jgi:hypothetical protein
MPAHSLSEVELVSLFTERQGESLALQRGEELKA